MALAVKMSKGDDESMDVDKVVARLGAVRQ